MSVNIRLLGVEYRDGHPYSINIRPLRGHAVATHPANCSNHDSHDLRISRIFISHHVHHSNHIKITVQTKDAKDAIRGEKVSNLTSHSLTSQKRCIFAA